MIIRNFCVRYIWCYCNLINLKVVRRLAVNEFLKGKIQCVVCLQSVSVLNCNEINVDLKWFIFTYEFCRFTLSKQQRNWLKQNRVCLCSGLYKMLKLGVTWLSGSLNLPVCLHMNYTREILKHMWKTKIPFLLQNIFLYFQHLTESLGDHINKTPTVV
jgi:hypothetical protein